MGIPSLRSWYKLIVFLNLVEVLLVLLYTFHYTKNDFVLQNSKLPVYHAHHRRNVMIFILKKYAPYTLIRKGKKTLLLPNVCQKKCSPLYWNRSNIYQLLEEDKSIDMDVLKKYKTILGQIAEMFLCLEFIRCKRYKSIYGSQYFYWKTNISVSQKFTQCHLSSDDKTILC